ncbi:MAG TPA: hypothetical protein GXX32_04310 [Methanothermobacter sp.]|nr:hypothetical protein [Methanothermobacter sp.]
MIVPKIPNSKKWKEALEEKYNFRIIEEASDIPDNALWSISCSKTKKLLRGLPKDLYQGRYNQLFYRYMNMYSLKYGVLSDKYGIHMYDECLDYYDIHPGELHMEDKQKLGKMIRQKSRKYGFKKIVFYYPSPLLSKPYFHILWFSRVPVYYITNIKLLDE